MELLDKIINYMTAKGHPINTAPGHMNVVYVEGIDSNGSDNPAFLPCVIASLFDSSKVSILLIFHKSF